jgi:hypothetical protein
MAGEWIGGMAESWVGPTADLMVGSTVEKSVDPMADRTLAHSVGLREPSSADWLVLQTATTMGDLKATRWDKLRG